MGYMTPILFLNDAASTLKANPEKVTENILRAMNDVSGRNEHYGVAGHCNPMTPLRPMHADVPRLMIAHQNTITEYGHMSNLNDRYDLIEYRKRNLKIAKEILKQEEEMINKMEQDQNK